MTPMARSVVIIACSLLALPGCGRAKPAHEDEHEDEAHQAAIHLARATQEALGITVVAAEVKPLEQTLEVTGQIAQDTDRLSHVNPPEAGTVAQLLVTIGQQVQPETPVAVVTSTKTQAPIQILAPREGLVLGVHTSVGATVDTLTSLMTIADLSQVWATFDLYEQDVALAQVGQRIDAESIAYPGRTFPGQVVFISPQVDPHTRTIKVRARIENPDYALKLGMFVTGTLYIPTAEQALVVPRAALQRIEKEPVIFVQTGPETFEAREVKSGQETRREVQILEGVKPGESVVASGSFHLKAELLKGTLEEGHAH